MKDTEVGQYANEHQYVDLGLPSNTLWATCNIGATSPEESGDYFCWGEIQIKTYYNLSTYSFFRQDGYGYEVSHSGYDKYVPQTYLQTLGFHKFYDNKIELDPEDDAAHMNWGDDWRIPTEREFEELRSLCSWEWTELKGVKGYKVTGPNGNCIFFPAARKNANDEHGLIYDFGQYLSSTLNEDNPSSAKCLYFSSDEFIVGNALRCYGSSVRPVFVSHLSM